MQVEFAGAAELGGSLALSAARDCPSDLTRTQATPAAAFRAARRTYLRGQRVDMQALACQGLQDRLPRGIGKGMKSCGAQRLLQVAAGLASGSAAVAETARRVQAGRPK